MDQPAHKPGHFPNQKRGLGSMISTIILVVVIILIVAYLAISWHGVTTVTSTQKLAVTAGQSTYFKLQNSSDTYSLYLKNTSSAYVTIYISKVPVLTNPIVTFDLVIGQSDNISADGSSQNADLQVKLVSSNQSGATIDLISIPTLFTIKTSPGVEIRYPASFYTPNNASTATPPPAVNYTNTNKSTKNTTTTNTTKTNTTKKTAPTSPSKPTALENISVILNATYIGTLMNDYKALYMKDRGCTEGAYDAALVTYANQQPVGPLDFANASKVTPTQLTVNATHQSDGKYPVTYSVVTPSRATSGPILTMDLNLTTGVITDLTFKGIFLGDNYSDIDSAYKFQAGISGACGAYIP